MGLILIWRSTKNAINAKNAKNAKNHFTVFPAISLVAPLEHHSNNKKAFYIAANKRLASLHSMRP
jgi:hypothetical protein